jgi:hypothetical protein
VTKKAKKRTSKSKSKQTIKSPRKYGMLKELSALSAREREEVDDLRFLLHTGSVLVGLSELGVYLNEIPKVVPRGMVLVHNFSPTRQQQRHIGMEGWRIWLSAHDPKRWKRCYCSWRPEHWSTKGRAKAR